MNGFKIETTVQTDGELHLSGLPCHQGDKIEGILLIKNATFDSDDRERKRAQEREEGRREFLALARASKFRSTGPYPTRDEIYERH